MTIPKYLELIDELLDDNMTKLNGYLIAPLVLSLLERFCENGWIVELKKVDGGKFLASARVEGIEAVQTTYHGNSMQEAIVGALSKRPSFTHALRGIVDYQEDKGAKQ